MMAGNLSLFSQLALFVTGNSTINAAEKLIVHNFFLKGTQPFPFILIENSTLSTGQIDMGGLDILFSNATITGTSRVNIGAEHTLSLTNGTTINSNSPVLLLVDGNLRHPLQIGTGSFQMSADSAITGSRIEIWTARQQFNTILGTLNGQKFTPGPIYQNSGQEYWGVYFPEHPLSGIPFAIYYKDAISAFITTLGLAGIHPFVAIAEMLRYLHPYDEYLVLAERFDALYNREDKRSYPGIDSSFADGENRRFFIRRPTFYDDRVPLIPPPWESTPTMQ